MSKTIHISYKWDQNLFVKSSENLYNYQIKNSRKRFLGWIFIAFTQFGVVLALKQGTFGMLLLASLLSFYWYVARWPMRKFLLLRGFNKSPHKNHIFHIELSNTALRIDDKNINFDTIYQAIEFQNYLILYIESSFVSIPFSAFETAAEQKQFLAIIKKNISNYIFYTKE